MFAAMKCFLITCCCFLFLQVAVAQTQDHFSDGDFTNTPTWFGDTAKFDCNNALQLQLNAPAQSDTATLYTLSNRIDTTEWQFWIKLDFSPSTTNQLRVYLTSDQSNFNAPNLNAYYLQLGATGSADAIEFYKTQSGTLSLLASGIAGHCGKSTNTLRIKVRRDLTGNWTIWSDTVGGHHFNQECVAFDNSISNTAYFGWRCLYTSTRSDKFYFDDVYIGAPVIDVTPPQLINVLVDDQQRLSLQFDEELNTTSSSQLKNFIVSNGIGNPDSVQLDVVDFSLLQLHFNHPFQTANYQLQVDSISDVSNNYTGVITTNFNYHEPQQFDVLITELMADPAPVVNLPNYEYIELYNNSGVDLDLKNWRIGDSSNSYIVSPKRFIFKADSFLILCSTTATTHLQSYGTVKAPSGFPSLNNTGDVIQLTSPSGLNIHTVIYTDDWYGSSIKKDGGWSLELIDRSNPCNGSKNWKASEANDGGTPGKLNSVNGIQPDITAPRLERAYVLADTIIRLVFNETLLPGSITWPSNYSCVPSVGSITSATLHGFEKKEVELHFSTKLQSNVVYCITVQNISDCSLNTVNYFNSTKFGIPLAVDSGDLLINEILFNPKPNSYDFIEIYNQSDKLLDIHHLKIANRNSLGEMDNSIAIADLPYLCFPKTYIVLTYDKANLVLNYPCKEENAIIENTHLPSMNDDEGYVLLLKPNGDRLDELHYSEKWHFPLLDDVEGVSLERISVSKPTQDEQNWHSAASVVGFATPTSINSQTYTGTNDLSNAISCEPTVFSPDNDGIKDYLTIAYNFDQPGNVCTIKVFDIDGLLIKTIIANATLNQNGSFRWDGTNQDGRALPYGYYIIAIETYNLTGKIQHYKTSCVVAGKN